MRTTIILGMGGYFMALVAACSGEISGSDVGQGGTSQAGSGGTSQAGSGGTSQAGSGGEGGAGQGGGGGADPQPRDFTVIIENQTSDPIFVDGLFLPFGLSFNGERVSSFTSCNCNQCNTGEWCTHGEPTPIAVEIPPDDSLEVDTALLRYVPQDVTETTCPELIPWDPVCGEAHALDAGTYQIRVGYDTLVAIEAQGLAPTTQTQWGHTVWMEPSPDIGVVQLTRSVEDSILLDDSSPVVHTMTVSGP